MTPVEQGEGYPPTLRVGVIGVGHLGAYHLQKYARHPSVCAVTVYDRNPEAARVQIAEAHGVHRVQMAASLEQCLAACEAVSIAVPTCHHEKLVREALAAGCHVLVEKPIAATAAEAEAMVRAAEEADRLLQVGHIERFNPALQGLEREEIVPRFIEAHRLAPYNPRGTDVPVVHDLMVHDLDLILYLVGEAPIELHASGVAVITGRTDIANARLTFPSGCVANVTASRISLGRMRKVRIFQPQAYLSLDLQQGSRELVRLRPSDHLLEREETPVMSLGEQVVTRFEYQGSGDALALEIDAFLRGVLARTRGAPSASPHGVTGREAADALALAEEITRHITPV